jgi:hypothetical protein
MSADNRLQHYFKDNKPVLRREFYFVHDLIDLYDDVQKGRCELQQFVPPIRRSRTSLTDLLRMAISIRELAFACC